MKESSCVGYSVACSLLDSSAMEWFWCRKFSAVLAWPNQPSYLPVSNSSFQGFVRKSVGAKCSLCMEGWPNWIPAFAINRYLQMSLWIFVSVVSSFVTARERFELYMLFSRIRYSLRRSSCSWKWKRWVPALPCESSLKWWFYQAQELCCWRGILWTASSQLLVTFKRHFG